MGNRKLPFGYQMRMGEIIRNEPEAKAVQDIFLQYTLGASLKEIAEQMSKTGPANRTGSCAANAEHSTADAHGPLSDENIPSGAVPAA